MSYENIQKPCVREGCDEYAMFCKHHPASAPLIDEIERLRAENEALLAMEKYLRANALDDASRLAEGWPGQIDKDGYTVAHEIASALHKQAERAGADAAKLDAGGTEGGNK